MPERKINVTLATLESHNHIVGDIERGVKIYEHGGIDLMEREDGQYWAHVPHKGETKAVTVTFTPDGQDIEQHSCHCSFRASGNPVCRHVVAAVLAIQGGIPESELALGKRYWFASFVEDKDTAAAIGSGDLEVLATPRMIALMEHAACMALEDALDDGQTSVGTSINVSHTAASPVGIQIEIEAIITSVKGRSITFEVSASDEGGEIGRGTHTRVIVDGEKLLSKAKGRISSE